MEKRTLILVRHAQAGNAASDFERPLTRVGAAQAAGLGRQLADVVPVVNQCAVSASTRAVQTAAALRRNLVIEETWNDLSLYLCQIDSFIETARSFTGDVAMIVGHEPTVSSAGAALVTPDLRAQIGWGVATATALILEFDGQWSDLDLEMCSLHVVHQELSA
ncbi:SixA phosphatase family protein [Schaalia vaccimaxillae]|uniref:SixA phosphatase family protein n=1 Tax=Schaalia vaccimaxillae TaxID=183916 RepID=UPI0003B3D95A|nr:histidine phosphatase family protein [Schaalia vaccimaxillae]